ncbi:MAG: nuclear transport factor 2 family protein [Saprospiraceae bacterium]
MKLVCAILFLALTNAQAQMPSDLVTVKNAWKELWQAYQGGNMDVVVAHYKPNSTSITPDGRLQTGTAAMKEDWNNFIKMVDVPPVFSYEEPAIRLITPDVAVLNYATNADIKIGGQQVGGKMLGMAVLHKINGKWMIESDSMTPILAMPDGK